MLCNKRLGDVQSMVWQQIKARQAIQFEVEASRECLPGEKPEHSLERWLAVSDAKREVGNIQSKRNDLPMDVEMRAGALVSFQTFQNGFQNKRKQIYLTPWINRTRWHHCCVSQEISVRAGVHRDATTCSDESYIIRKGKPEIGYQNSPESSRIQTGRRDKNHQHCEFSILRCWTML